MEEGATTSLAFWHMDRVARDVRAVVYRTFADEGRAMLPKEIGVELGLDDVAVAKRLDELHDLHALVLTPDKDAIRMAHPFSAWPMGFVLRDRDRFWWGGCAWDSFGIVAALKRELEITTACPACQTKLQYTASQEHAPENDTIRVRLPRPAAQWWDDVVETCTNIRAYCSEEHVTRHGDDYVTDLPTLHKLAIPWYGDRLDPDYRPHTREHNQALLEACGLTGPFWALP
jgi:Alkylmercury lyase